MAKNKEQKPLTLDGLIKYNQDVLFPYLEETFVGKEEFNDFKNEMTGFKNEMTGFKNEMTGFKNEMTDFKNETLTSQDKILKKLDILLSEKEIREYQEKKEKKLWMIIIKSLREHNILSQKELEDIAKLEIF